MQIAIIGLGEVGMAYAKALKSAGHQLSLCTRRPSTTVTELAREWGVPLLHSTLGDWLHGCEWVLCCVTGVQALQVVEQCAAQARAGTLVCDMTTASPETKRTAAHTARQRGLHYLDVAIMGAVALAEHSTPLLVAGEAAVAFQEILEQAGGRVSVVEGGQAGDAVALKILRSVFTKGLEALSVELLMAAERQGMREQLYAQLQDIDKTPLRTFMDMLVRTHVVHARRRAHETSDACAELAGHHIYSLVLPGVQARFERTIAALDRDRPVEAKPSTEQALQWLLRNEG